MNRIIILTNLAWSLAIAADGLAQTSPPVLGGAAEGDVVIRPGDILRVTVWPDASLGGEFPVEESGDVFLPFLGSVEVAGLQLDDLRDRLRLGYEEVRKNPVVTVTPLFAVAVVGEVARPGIYTLAPTNSVFDAIGMAGWLSREADGRKIRILREGRAIQLDAIRALRSGVEVEALQLRSGDMVIVPTRRRGFTWGTFVTVLQTVSLGVLVVDRLSN